MTQLPPSMGAEDFAYLARVVPACYVWLGNGPGEGGCMLHSPHYDFNGEIIATGSATGCGLRRGRWRRKKNGQPKLPVALSSGALLT